MCDLVLQEKPLSQDEEGGILTGERRLLLKAVSRHVAGAYQCVAANSEGEARSEAIMLRVQCEYLESKYCVLSSS